MKRAWAIAWRNLQRNRRRNLATFAAIAFGYAGLLLLGGYAVRVERFLKTNAVFLQQAGHVAVFAPDGLDCAGAEPEKCQLDEPVQQAILQWAQRDPRVERATRYLRGVGMAGNACSTRPAQLVGVDLADHRALMHHPELLEASPELAAPATGQWPFDRPELKNGVALAAGLATLLQKPKVWSEVQGLPPAPLVLACDTPAAVTQLAADANIQVVGITYDGTLNAVDGEMTATFHAPDPQGEEAAMLLPLPLLQQLFATDRVTYVALLLRDHTQAQAVAQDLRAALLSQGRKLDTWTFQDQAWAPYYVGTMAFLGSMVGFITLLVSVVLVLTVAGAMTLAILERTRELGTWRALGFQRGQLTALLVREAALLSLLGLAAGLGIGLGVAYLVNSAGLRFSPPGVAGSIQLLITPSALSCALQALLLPPGVALATWWVARGQLRKKPVDLLITPTS